jgi:hypothetical protein
LFSDFKNEVEQTHFNPSTIPITDIKIEMMDGCKEQWLLYFE